MVHRFRTSVRAFIGALPLVFLTSNASAQLPCFDDETTFMPPGNESSRSIAMDGNLAAVGFASTSSEFVQVYRRVDEMWVAETQLSIPPGSTGSFGISVDVDPLVGASFCLAGSPEHATSARAAMAVVMIFMWFTLVFEGWRPAATV